MPAGNSYNLKTFSQSDEGNLGNTTLGDALSSLQKHADTFFLRIMPLGASITQGMGSSDETGYRKYLRQQLRFDFALTVSR
jgi:hypothetical protein